METLLKEIRLLFEQSFVLGFPGHSCVPHLDIKPSVSDAFGDYQCNSAMGLAKLLKQSPRDIANTWVKALETLPHPFAKLEVAGPGFINIHLKDQYLLERMSSLAHDPRLGVAMKMDSQRVIVDFSSPNVAKQMHVGHLRSTVIGDCIAKVLAFLGDDVLPLNHIGDWGTAFGMLIVYLEQYQPQVLSGKVSVDLDDLVAWYKLSKQQFDADEAFKKASQLKVVALQSNDSQALAAWSLICELSRRSYQAIYDYLGVSIVERGESFYNELLRPTVDQIKSQGLTEESDGATCVFLDGFVGREDEPLPIIIQKQDGGFNYSSTDLAAVFHRVYEEKADRIIYVTDAGQALHFSMIFALAQKMGWAQPDMLLHVPFGLVLGSDGKKFKTRSGRTEPLIGLLDEAVSRARAILEQRHPEWSEDAISNSAKRLGIGAVKYADLSVSRTSDYAFSYDKMLKFEGNTVAFVLYAYVRAHSILDKSNYNNSLEFKINLKYCFKDTRSLVLKLQQLPEVLSSFSKDLLPNRLTDYLYALSKTFNQYLRDCQVLGHEDEAYRLMLCDYFKRVMALVLGFLGIDVLEKM